jgi:hypothetical protein
MGIKGLGFGGWTNSFVAILQKADLLTGNSPSHVIKHSLLPKHFTVLFKLFRGKYVLTP